MSKVTGIDHNVEIKPGLCMYHIYQSRLYGWTSIDSSSSGTGTLSIINLSTSHKHSPTPCLPFPLPFVVFMCWGNGGAFETQTLCPPIPPPVTWAVTVIVTQVQCGSVVEFCFVFLWLSHVMDVLLLTWVLSSKCAFSLFLQKVVFT